MKKFLTLLFLTLIVILTNIACEDSNENLSKNSIDLKSESCTKDSLFIALSNYYTNPDNNHQKILDWLNLNGERFCTGDLVDCLGSIHKINYSTYTTMRSLHPNGSDEYIVAWPEIKNLIDNIQCWENHLVLNINNNKVNFDIQPFDSNKVCYSKPFLFSLQTKLNLDDNDVFIFSNAVSNPRGINKDDIIFRIEVKDSGNNLIETTYYDISDNPT